MSNYTVQDFTDDGEEGFIIIEDVFTQGTLVISSEKEAQALVELIEEYFEVSCFKYRNLTS